MQYNQYRRRYDSNPGGGCVVGRCSEACPSWLPVSLVVSAHDSLARLKVYYALPGVSQNENAKYQT